MNSARSSSLSLKYQRFTLSGCKDLGIRKFEFVAVLEVHICCRNFHVSIEYRLLFLQIKKGLWESCEIS